MQDGGPEEGNGVDQTDSQNGAEQPDDTDDPWEPPVDHPGRKYERIAQRYEPDESDEPEDGVADPGAADDTPQVSAALRTRFWALVLVFNLALAGMSVGAMFVVFESDWTLGSQLFVAGAILFAYGFYRYRRVQRRLEQGELGADGDGDGDG